MSGRPELSAAQRAELRERLRRLRAGGAEPAVPRRAGTAPPPLAPAQERLWFLEQLAPGSELYNIGRVLALPAALDRRTLAAALAGIAGRHLPLAAAIVERAGAAASGTASAPAPELAPGTAPETVPETVLEAAPCLPLPLGAADLRALPAGRRGSEADRLAAAVSRRPFDLGRAPLWRALLADLGDRGRRLVLVVHHLVFDGWSEGVLFAELAERVRAAGAGEPPRLPPLARDYGDYAAWQRERLRRGELERDLAWWRERLAAAPAPPALPADRPEPAVRSLAAGARRVRLPADLAEGLRRLARAAGAGLFMALVAGWAALLARLTGARDLVIGTAAAGRDEPELEPLIGFFVNTLPLRLRLDGGDDAAAAIARAREAVGGALDHRAAPFARLVEEAAPARRGGWAPLFETLILLDRPGEPPRWPDGSPLVLDEVPKRAAELDLMLLLREGEGEIGGRLVFRRDLFDAATAERLVRRLTALLAAWVEHPGLTLDELPLLGRAERHQLLAEWGSGDGAYPRDATVASAFAVQAAARPDAIAVDAGGETLSYGALAAAARDLARRLAGEGVGPESRVAVLAGRSVEALVATVAVVEAGAAYVPLDPSYPPERLAWMLADSSAALVVTDGRSEGAVPPGVRRLRLGRPRARAAAAPDPAPAPSPTPAAGGDALLYVMYTSGSTGRPKGVAVPYRAVLRLVSDPGYVRLGPGATLLQLAPTSFDAATLEIWGALLTGGRLALAPPEPPTHDGLAALLAERGVTTLWLTAGLFHQMVDERPDGLAGLETLLAGGEALSPPHVRRARERLPGVRLVDGYGPTENTTFTACHPIAAGDAVRDRPVPIGRPVPGTRVAVVDRAFSPVPIGAAGELCAGGDGLARGYLDRPRETAERFVPDPFGPEPGGRLYRTGDLVRWLPDGRLDFLGRGDGQVKLRGFRIELGEVEAALAGHPEVARAAAAVRPDPAGDPRLLAWAVPAAGRAPAAVELLAHLGRRLPPFMIPAAVAVVGELPLTANGKVDRSRLPDPPAAAAAAPGRRAPAGPDEELLAAIWRDSLGLEDGPGLDGTGAGALGADDDFFALGGHSLKAARVIARVRRALGVELPLAAIFECPTVALLAERIRAARLGGEAPAEMTAPLEPGTGPAPAAPAQERLWFLERLVPGRTVYGIPVVLRLEGPLDRARLRRALGALAARHEALRTRFAVEGGRLVQEVAPPAPAALPAIDLGALGRPEPEAERVAGRLARRPFDLGRGPLLRAALAVLGAGRHELVLEVHHAVADGWSLRLVLEELAVLYGGAEPPPPTAQAGAWARGCRSREESPAVATQVEWWRRRLAGLEPLALPVDRPRPAVQRMAGLRHDFTVPADLAAHVGRLAAACEATPFMVAAAAFAALLGRWSGRSDVAFGLPVAGREHAELERLVAPVANTVVLRCDLAGAPPFAELVARVRRAVLDAHARAEAPFERVVRAAEPARALDRAPLFQAMLTFQGEAPALDWPDLSASLRGIDHGGAAYDLTLGVTRRHADGWPAYLEADRDLFRRDTAARLAAHWLSLLAAACDAPGRPAALLPLADEPPAGFAGPAAPAAADPLARIRAAARERPEAPALVAGGRTLSRGALDRAAGRLAARLAAYGVGPEVPVALQLGRAPELVAAILAVLRAGGAFVVLDPALPPARRRALADDVRPALVLVDHDPAAAAVELGVPALAVGGCVGASVAAEAGAPVSPPGAGRTRATAGSPAWAATPGPVAVAPAAEVRGGTSSADTAGGEGAGRAAAAPAEALAYVVYTSGSSGRPKGVGVSRGALAAHLEAAGAALGLGEGDRVLQFASFAFDVAIEQLLAALAAGAAVVLRGDEPWGLPELERALAEHRVTVADLPTALWRRWAAALRPEALPAGLRLVSVGGEALPAAAAERWHRAAPARVALVNAYGPTEAVITASAGAVAPGTAPAGNGSLPLGRPLAGRRLHVLEPTGRPAPAMVPGELAIGGPLLARGYLGRPAATAERFVPDPFSAVPGARLYRTGDRARFRADGELEFLGRLDAQVKVRGFRIEPAEVEAAIAELPGVAEAAVAAAGDGLLAAWVVADAAPAELRRALGARLPEHMVPTDWILLDRLPRLPGGKVDRRALPAPERSAAPPEGLSPPAAGSGAPAEGPPAPAIGLSAPDAGSSSPAAGSSVPSAAPSVRALHETGAGGAEERVTAIWARVLGLREVGRERNFFDLGGHSLLLLEVQRALAEELGVEPPLVELFRHPTVASLAAWLDREGGGRIAAVATAAGTAAAPSVLAVPRPASAPGADAVAVVGMACRFPGADDPAALWDGLLAGREAIRRFTRDELAAAGADPERIDHPRFVPASAVVDGVDLFDEEFFGFNPRDAALTDPQQRVFLEVAWHALEDAGVDPRRFAGRIGVFAGVGAGTYLLTHLVPDPEVIRSAGLERVMNGNDKDALATMVAYKLDLRGPALTVQTACSTSLAAVHLARRSLLAGECDLAIAGGATLSLPERAGYLHEPGGILSPDGRCRSFGAGAAGTVPGSGAGAVVLRRLGDALADGDLVRAVVRGSAINNDGAAKVGYTAPGVDGQAEVIASALADAGVDPGDVGYVEAHGTGTPLGDPIELAALTRALGGRGGRCGIGSIKSNLGHLDTAAGVAGLIKAVLTVESGELPPSLHCEPPNPALGLGGGRFFLVAERQPWPGAEPRRAGVSSFGIGGTNVHAILEQAPGGAPAAGAEQTSSPDGKAGWQLLALSARSPAALDRAAAALAGRLGGDSPPPFAAAAFTLQTGRARFAHRRAVVARGPAEAAAALVAGIGAESTAVAGAADTAGAGPEGTAGAGAGDGAGTAGLAVAGLAVAGAPPVAFLFPGQGAQHPGMAAGLYRALPAYRERLDRCFASLAPLLGRDPLEAIERGGEHDLARTELAQPLLFAVEWALADLWRGWGIEPAALLGHSLGELTAACVAGVFTLDDALALVVARGRLMAAMPPGAMLAVALGEEDLLPRLGGGLALAAVNAPGSCAVAGPVEEIEALAAELRAEGTAVRRLAVAHGFHSPAAAGAVEPFRRAVAAVTRSRPRVPWVSGPGGVWVEPEQAVDPGYWAEQLRRPVRFSDAAATLLADPRRVLLEVGPGRTLASLVRRRPDAAGRAVLASLGHRAAGRDDAAVLLEALGGLWCAGVEPDWVAVHGRRRRRVSLPGYPFERRRHWIDVPRIAAGTAVAAVTATTEPVAPAPASGLAAPAPTSPGLAAPASAVSDPAGVPAPGAVAGPPLDPLEAAIAAIWREQLGVPRVAAGDGFLELGGDSLIAVRVMARVNAAAGVELPVSALFRAGTLGALAALYRQAAAEQAAAGGGAAAAALESVLGLSAEEVAARLGDGEEAAP